MPVPFSQAKCMYFQVCMQCGAWYGFFIQFRPERVAGHPSARCRNWNWNWNWNWGGHTAVFYSPGFSISSCMYLYGRVRSGPSSFAVV